MELNKEQLIKIARFNKAAIYTDIIPFELKVGLPRVNYYGFFAQPGECLIFAAPASTFEDKNRVVGYTGRSAGASFRVAKGVSVRTGSSGSRAIRSDIRNFYNGDLLVTNKRVIFTGKDDSFECAIDKITTATILTADSFVLQFGSRSKNITVDQAVLTVAYSSITYARDSFIEGFDMYTDHQRPLTPDQLALCDEVRQKVAKIRIPKNKSTQHQRLRAARLFALVAITISVIGIIILSYLTPNNTPSDSQVSSNTVVKGITNYSTLELLTLDDHPKIYDSFEDVVNYYNDIGDQRITILQGSKDAALKRASKQPYDADTVLYMTTLSDNDNYISKLEIIVNDHGFAMDMSVDKTVDIISTYLPDNFFNFYYSDASYTWSQSNQRTYTRSYRLNADGLNYRNTQAPHYSNYYYLRIVEYDNGARWEIQTGHAAYGDKGLDWINTYATPWDAPIQLQ